MFGAAYFGARYFAPEYFGNRGSAVVDGSYFGTRYFGPNYFGHRYFGNTGTGTVIVPIVTQGDLIWPWWWHQVYRRDAVARGEVLYAWAELFPGDAKGNARGQPDQAAAASCVISGIATTDGLSPPRVVTSSTVLLRGTVQAACLIRETEFVISAHIDAGIASICGYAPGAVLTVFIEDDEPQRMAA